KRGTETKEFKNLVLSGSVTAYSLPYLGILPMRDDPELGLAIRDVLPKSPAETAGLKSGDRIMKIGVAQTQPPRLIAFAGRDQFMSLIAGMVPGMELNLEVKRKQGGKTESVKIRLAQFDSSVPESISDESTAKRALEKVKTPAGPPMPISPPKPGDPPMPKDPPRPKLPRDPKKADDDKKPDDKKPVEKGLLKRTNQARDHEYWVFVPDNYDPNVAHGLLIWLHAAGKGGKDADSVKDIWEDYCEKNHLILLGPKAESDNGWLPSESEFIAQTARDLMREYTIDRQRVVTHGTGIGGQMAFYLGFNARDIVRGVASTSAALATQPKDAVINQRLAFYIVAGTKDPIAPQIKKSHQTLGEKKFPSQFREIEMGREYLDRKTLDEMVRWIDSLDRI
ncbi:MAG TPA: PDZ domain-containing protein, partial [Chloroflexota bacterium]|nr:PDZ domain-containing protein [Chloroflexota bacterium]